MVAQALPNTGQGRVKRDQRSSNTSRATCMFMFFLSRRARLTFACQSQTASQHSSGKTNPIMLTPEPQPYPRLSDVLPDDQARFGEHYGPSTSDRYGSRDGDEEYATAPIPHGVVYPDPPASPRQSRRRGGSMSATAMGNSAKRTTPAPMPPPSRHRAMSLSSAASASLARPISLFEDD